MMVAAVAVASASIIRTLLARHHKALAGGWGSWWCPPPPSLSFSLSLSDLIQVPASFVPPQQPQPTAGITCCIVHASQLVCTVQIPCCSPLFAGWVSGYAMHQMAAVLFCWGLYAPGQQQSLHPAACLRCPLMMQQTAACARAAVLLAMCALLHCARRSIGLTQAAPSCC